MSDLPVTTDTTDKTWDSVPNLVKLRYKTASGVQFSIAQLANKLPKSLKDGYGSVYWNADEEKIWVNLSKEDSEQLSQRWHNYLQAVPGVSAVDIHNEQVPKDTANWIKIPLKEKRASSYNPYNWAGKLTDGPSPMSNAIVSGLLGTGLGYGAGWLGETLFPEKYLEKGKLRRNLALLGGGLGTLTGLPKGFANAGMNREATGDPRWFESFLKGDGHQQIGPNELNYKKLLESGSNIAQHTTLPAVKAAACRNYIKEAFSNVNVEHFNKAIWGDVKKFNDPYRYSNLHTHPAHAAATSGLVTGIQQKYGGSSLLSPKHFISGLAAAGVDTVTSKVVGKTLGLLGGLTPEAQDKLQDVGLWSGMIRGVTKSVFNF